MNNEQQDSESFLPTITTISTPYNNNNELNHHEVARDEADIKAETIIIEEEIYPDESSSPTIMDLRSNNTLPSNNNNSHVQNKNNSIPRMSNVISVNKQNEKNQLRMIAALNGHVIFSHHPKELGELYHVEWWYYLSTFDHTMIPFFKHSQDGDTSIIQIGNAIHCRDYQLKLVNQNKFPTEEVACDLSHFWSSYYFDNQHRIITQSPVAISMDHLHHDNTSKLANGGHENSMIEDEESFSEFNDNSSQDEEIHSINFDQWIETRQNHEEPQLIDTVEQGDYFLSNNDDDYLADISNMSMKFNRNYRDEIAHDATDSRMDDFYQSHVAKEHDKDKQQDYSTTQQRKDEEMMLSLDQFIESSSYHINEQFKIISREFSRIFF